MKSLLIALQFLTVIPLRDNAKIDESDIANSASFFVAVGLFQGMLLVAADSVFGLVFQPDLVTVLLLLVLVLTNGGFHLDGLADTFDAVAAQTDGDIAGSRQKRLAIMRDGSVGPVGVTAIFFALAVKYFALRNLADFPVFTYYSALILMPVLPKWVMVMSMFHGMPAREDGLGRVFISRIGNQEAVISTLTLLALLLMPLVFFSAYVSGGQYLLHGILLAILYFLSRYWVRYCNGKFGGLTGDTLGAVSEITETVFLLAVITWSQHSF